MSAGRILVVDDDPQIRRVMRVTLTGQGYEVDDVKSGEAALEKLRDERFDLVLLDMNMPGMGGLETCRAIRSQSEIAIIMLTVRDSESDRSRRLTRRTSANGLAADAVDAWTSASVEVDFDTRHVITRPPVFPLNSTVGARCPRTRCSRIGLSRASGVPTAAIRSTTSASS